jgi:hypothetical protein
MVSLHQKYSFTLNVTIKTINQDSKVTSCPFRVTLGPFWIKLASWSKMLGLLGP